MLRLKALFRRTTSSSGSSSIWPSPAIRRSPFWAKRLHISIPTVTKLVEELLAENIIADRGKIETSGGRRPNVYGLTNSAIYFAGIEVSRDQIVLVITDLQNNIIQSERKSDFALDDTDECLETICSTIENFLAGSGIDRTKLLGIGVCMAGRVNPKTGRSYKISLIRNSR